MAYNPEMEKLKSLQLLKQQMSGQATAPQVPVQAPMAAPQVPVQAPMAAPQVPVQAPMAAVPAQAPQAKPSFFERLGQGFDRAATGGIIDPTTLTKDQRRILRGQLLMNIGGALSQNRPIGEGFQQQYNMLNKRQEEQAAKAKAALTAQQEATRQQIYQNADWSTPEGAQKLVNDLASAGLYQDAMEVTKNVSQKFKDGYTVMSDPRYGTILVDPTGKLPPQQINIPGATPIPRAPSRQPMSAGNTWPDPDTGIIYEIRNGLPYRRIN
jgi:hypothetical protein